MRYQEIDMASYARKAHFSYFSSLAYPYAGLSAQVEIGRFLRLCKAEKAPFFLSILYEIMQAANAVPEFRQRIQNGSIIEYEWCRSSHTVALEDGTYCYCTLDAQKSRSEFLSYAAPEQERAKSAKCLEDDEDSGDLIFVSCLPWLHYTSLIQPVPFPADSNPRLTWGKYAEENGRVLLPVTVLVHHALIDGRQIADFFEILQSRFDRFML